MKSASASLSDLIIVVRRLRTHVSLGTLLSAFFLLSAQSGCTNTVPDTPIVPRTLAEVPAEKLAFRFDPDVTQPQKLVVDDDPNKKDETVQKDFDSSRKDDALIRTVESPDGKRLLALYATGETSTSEFKIDLYSSDGAFLRNITTPDMAGAFPEMAAWSPDGSTIAFIARRTVTPSPSPTPEALLNPLPGASPLPAPSVVAPVSAVPVFDTEQIYTADQDGFNLRPLTSKQGLIYFAFSFMYDGKSIAALACKEDEWDANEKHNLAPTGRPRLIRADGTERLLDDELSSALPDESPDGTKIAVAVGDDVKIYDLGVKKPTQALIPLNDLMIKASVDFEAKTSKNKNSGPPAAAPEVPVSFNPIVKLDWVTDQDLYLKTAAIRIYGADVTVTFQRWHRLSFSPQASLMKEQKAG